MDVTRFEELPVLDAAADRTQLTTVLTEDGQMLTQASFMVKNNDRQFQKFTLPEGAEFWACYVGDEPVKAGEERTANCSCRCRAARTGTRRLRWTSCTSRRWIR